MGMGSSGVLESVLILCVCVLSLKMLFLGVRTAQARGTAKRFVNSEDAAWLGGETVPVDIDTAARWHRAHRNDVENFVPFVALGAAYLLLGGSAYAGLTYVLVFTVARILHTVAYLNHKARLRRDTYTAGFLVLAIMAFHVATLGVGKLVG
jgi:prostaglandin-E synthase 1